MQMEKIKKIQALPAGVRKMGKDELRTLNYEPVFIPERLGWYVATDIIDGLDLYRGGGGYASYADYDVNWTAYCYSGVGGKAQ